MHQSAPYRVRARNSARESENQIHDDDVAARYGFRGGLVPGVNVYGYMTVPVVSHFGREWLERGKMDVKFIAPFYEGEEVIVRAQLDSGELLVTAEGEDGKIRATATAGLHTADVPDLNQYHKHPLPDPRPEASAETVQRGRVLGSLCENLRDRHARLLETLEDHLPIYGDALHPAAVLAMANEILIRNFRLSPWIHTASAGTNWNAASREEEIAIGGSITDCYERKGHQFLVLDLLLTGASGQTLARVLHTAIWRLR